MINIDRYNVEHNQLYCSVLFKGVRNVYNRHEKLRFFHTVYHVCVCVQQNGYKNNNYWPLPRLFIAQVCVPDDASLQTSDRLIEK